MTLFSQSSKKNVELSTAVGEGTSPQTLAINPESCVSDADKETQISPAQTPPTNIPQNGQLQQDDPRLQQILRAAKRGWLVFPVTPHEKVPMKGFKWKELATDNEQKLREWFALYPEHNWGARTGIISGMFVIDIDGHKNGFETLAALEEANGQPLPQTLATHTGSGKGKHFIFQLPHNGMMVNNSIGEHCLGEGVDVRGEGGYIVIPPSTTSTAYSFEDEDAEIAYAPNWLLEILVEPTREQGSHHSELRSGTMGLFVKGNETIFCFAAPAL